jgi:hypothetical protein
MKPLTAKDVIVSPIDKNKQLVWIITTRFATGDALGPLAIVERLENKSFAVRALGPLRANPLQVSLRLRKIGKLEVVVAEGDQCASTAPSSCRRAARLVPLRGTRFSPEPLLSKNGTCLAPAWINLSRQELVPLKSGRQRHVKLETAMLFSNAAELSIQEQVTVHDSKPGVTSPQLPYRAESEIYVKAIGNRLFCSDTPLWNRIMETSLSEVE